MQQRDSQATDMADTGDEEFVFERVLHSMQSITHGIFDLRNGMIVWSLNEYRARFWILRHFHKRKFIIAQDMFVNKICMAQTIWTQFLLLHRTKHSALISLWQRCNRVDGFASTCKHESLHIPSLCSSETQDPFLCQQIERKWIDAFLIDDNKRLICCVANLNNKTREGSGLPHLL